MLLSPLIVLFLSSIVCSDPHFFHIGDWGSATTTAEYAQTQRDVARSMSQYAQVVHPSWVLSSGDNFYNHGATSVQDPIFNLTFTQVYSAQSLQIPWYMALGNHDYEGNVSAQIDYTTLGTDSRWKMYAHYYNLSLPRLNLFVLDTNPGFYQYRLYPENERMKDQLANESWSQQIQWVKGVLPKHCDPQMWTIVMGHHPLLYPNFTDTLLPLLVENKCVDLYICGHIHNLELLKYRDLLIVISGAGSRLIEHDYSIQPDFDPEKDLEFSVEFLRSAPGFIDYTLGVHELTLTYREVTEMESKTIYTKKIHHRF